MIHISVLRKDVQKYLRLKRGERVVDATLGLGGHSLDILKAIGEKGILYAFEMDERNLSEAKKRLKKYESQIIFFHDNFRTLKNRITGVFSADNTVDAILFDLGLSSPHVDESERGFSFLRDGPLDMRFDKRGKKTAASILDTYSEQELSDIFFRFGEERMSRVIARKICEERKVQKFETTKQLADFLEKVLPRSRSKKGKSRHPATRIFQALRIAVNDELSALEEALQGAMEILRVGGRVVVISYHSLEDRIVKRFFQDLEKPEIASPEKAIYQVYDDPIVERLTRKPVIPTEKELEQNPRCRSAKLRAYRKIRELN